MKELRPKDLQALARIKTEFSGKPRIEKEHHIHAWEQVKILKQPGFGIFNDRVVGACFACGRYKRPQG